MPESPSGKCHVFICYRQADGLHTAEWLYQKLQGRTIQLDRSQNLLELDVYFDRTAPGIDNWREYWEPKLEVSRALVFVCTRGAARRRDGTDWVYAELDYWLTHKTRGPIIVETTGHGDRYVPGAIKERWPDAQRIESAPQLATDEAIRRRLETRAVERILNGIKLSEEGIYFEELEHLRTLNRNLELETARAEAGQERATTAQVNLLVRNGMAAIEDGYLLGAAVWFAEALRVDAERGASEDAHRVRLQALSRRVPSLRRLWFLGGKLAEIRFLPVTGRLVVLRDGELRRLGGPGPDTVVPLEPAAFVVDMRIPDGDTDVVQVLSAPARRSGRAGDELASRDLDDARPVSRWSADGARIFDFSASAALVCSAGRLQLVALADGAPTWSEGWIAPSGDWRLGALTAQGSVIAAGETGLWRRTATADSAPVCLDGVGRVDRLVINRSGRGFAAVKGKEVWIWPAETSEPLRPDLSAELTDIQAVVDLEFGPDAVHVLVTVRTPDDRRTTLIVDLARDPRHGVVARIDHEQAVERWEYTPPQPGGGAAATVAGMKAVDPFEKAARFSPDGRLIGVVSDVDRHVRVWDWRSGQAMTPPLQILGQPSRAFAFSPDGAAIGLARRDGLVALWDFAQPVGDVPPIRTTDRVDHLVFSPDGARLAFAGYAGRAEIWDVARGERGVALTGHQEAITAITFSPDGLVVATSSYDKTVRVFDALTGRTISEPLRHEHAVHAACFHGSSKLLTIASTWDGPSQVSAWQLPEGRQSGALALDADLVRACWNAAGSRVAILPRWPTTYGLDEAQRAIRGRPRIWEPASDRVVELPTETEVEWIAFSDDDTRVWTCAGGRIEEFSPDDGTRLGAWAWIARFPGYWRSVPTARAWPWGDGIARSTYSTAVPARRSHRRWIIRPAVASRTAGSLRTAAASSP